MLGRCVSAAQSFTKSSCSGPFSGPTGHNSLYSILSVTRWRLAVIYCAFLFTFVFLFLYLDSKNCPRTRPRPRGLGLGLESLGGLNINVRTEFCLKYINYFSCWQNWDAGNTLGRTPWKQSLYNLQHKCISTVPCKIAQTHLCVCLRSSYGWSGRNYLTPMPSQKSRMLTLSFIMVTEFRRWVKTVYYKIYIHDSMSDIRYTYILTRYQNKPVRERTCTRSVRCVHVIGLPLQRIVLFVWHNNVHYTTVLFSSAKICHENNNDADAYSSTLVPVFKHQVKQ